MRLPPLQRSSGVGARLQVVQLQLSLLNRLCLAGPTPTDGPQKLFLAQVRAPDSGGANLHWGAAGTALKGCETLSRALLLPGCIDLNVCWQGMSVSSAFFEPWLGS